MHPDRAWFKARAAAGAGDATWARGALEWFPGAARAPFNTARAAALAKPKRGERLGLEAGMDLGVAEVLTRPVAHPARIWRITLDDGSEIVVRARSTAAPCALAERAAGGSKIVKVESRAIRERSGPRRSEPGQTGAIRH